MTLKPLLAGRLLRIAAGLVCFYFVFEITASSIDVGEVLAALALALLGLSFVIGGLSGNPGCEITALPNLLLERKRHFF